MKAHLGIVRWMPQLPASTQQVMQIATALGLKGKGDKVYLIKQILKIQNK